MVKLFIIDHEICISKYDLCIVLNLYLFYIWSTSGLATMYSYIYSCIIYNILSSFFYICCCILPVRNCIPTNISLLPWYCIPIIFLYPSLPPAKYICTSFAITFILIAAVHSFIPYNDCSHRYCKCAFWSKQHYGYRYRIELVILLKFVIYLSWRTLHG